MSKDEDNNISKLLNPNFHKTALYMRACWVGVALIIPFLGLMTLRQYVIFGVSITIAFLYQLVFFPLISKNDARISAYGSLITYLIPLFVLIAATGGINSPFYVLLYFIVIGTALSFGSQPGLVIGGVELLFLVFLIFFHKEYTGSTILTYAIKGFLLFLYIPFSGIAAKRYADVLDLKIKREKLNKELKKNIAHLKEIQQKERDIIDIMGHELRTPMSIIKNYFALLKKPLSSVITSLDEANLSKVNKYIEGIDENIGREIKLINTLLSATILEDASLELNKEPVDVIDVIEDSIVGQETDARKKQLQLKFQKPSGWETYPRIFADRVRIQEAVDNILSNSVKYTEKGDISINIEHDKDFVTIHIKDTGIGMSEKELQNLGTKFYRAKQYTTDSQSTATVIRPGGSGLGLFVTYGVIKAHGGQIRAESSVGKGSTFHVKVPLYKGQKSSKESKPRDMFKRSGLTKTAGSKKSHQNSDNKK